MTQHEINNLVKLLMSGDEQNILMAKAICEGQKCVEPVKIAYRSLKRLVLENDRISDNLYDIYRKDHAGVNLKKYLDFAHSSYSEKLRMRNSLLHKTTFIICRFGVREYFKTFALSK